ncbi:hypothetical protein [Devosia sp.]|uniref:hypothetical protein n=1 Tax=Devosia sp. TaxID=1871048 RepID=UPI001B1D005B|nr:hypothetical protein [Devosia sp.]MBO9588527.1 hypothetical protein [Devosia sp.]
MALVAAPAIGAECLLVEFCARQILPNVKFRTTIIEYVDITGTGAGHSLSRLNWREAFSAIYDQAGAGVIYALDRNDELTGMLGTDDQAVMEEFIANGYHREAVAIAGAQGAHIALWGSVLEDKGDILFQPSLSVFPGDSDWLDLSLSGENGVISELTLDIPAWRIDFQPDLHERAALFARPLLTRCGLSSQCPDGVDVRAGPSNKAEIVGKLPVGAAIAVEDITEQWFLLTHAERQSYLNLYHTEMIPQTVTTSRAGQLWVSPDGGAERSTDVRAGEVLDVVGAQRLGGRLWLELRSATGSGWITDEGWIPHYSHPAIHLVNGFTRFGLGNFRGAVRAFRAFTDQAKPEDNVALSIAHQMAALSLVQAAEAADNLEEAVAHLARAQQFTPFDPVPFAIEGAVRLQLFGETKTGVQALNHAIELDGADPVLTGLLRQLCSGTFPGQDRLKCDPVADASGQ